MMTEEQIDKRYEEAGYAADSVQQRVKGISGFFTESEGERIWHTVDLHRITCHGETVPDICRSLGHELHELAFRIEELGQRTQAKAVARRVIDAAKATALAVHIIDEEAA